MPTLENLKFLDKAVFKKISHFENAEYTERLSAVRAGMKDHGIRLMILTRPESVRYLTGYHTFGSADQFLLVPLDGEIVHVLRILESFLTLVYSQVPPQNVHYYEDTPGIHRLETTGQSTGRSDESLLHVVARAVGEMKCEAAVIGTEGCHMTVMTYQRLQQLLPRAAWKHIDGDLETSIVESARDLKSSVEIGYMKEAGRIGLRGVRSGLEAVKIGATDNDVAAAITAELIREGSERLVVFPIVTSGWRSGIPHSTFERQRIGRGDTVLIEHTAVYCGYSAPIMRTIVAGEPSPKIQEMSDVVLKALRAALSRLRSGVAAGEVDEACRRVIEAAGYSDNFRKRTGYSVGLKWIEHLSAARADGTILRPGMVFHLPVALREYGRCCVGLSTTAAVTDGEPDIITEIPSGILVRN